MSPKTYREKNQIKRNLTDEEELDLFFRTNYPFQNYPKGILITKKILIFFILLYCI